ncbi:SDR family NAD(P)-dependent oxidoreductase [Pseudonocardia nematodicida]|uniref:SDR family NAD(P)-dependent oxidoreductase n=1 Tax=Pseudonocardia nematodicida TaxID=1206997 RepID=A0ABV1KG46_9PSEU
MTDDEHGCVVVTGAASGICRAAGLRLARDGLVVAAFDRDGEGLASLRKEIEDSGGRVDIREVDVAEPAALREAVDGVARATGGVRAVVHGAGVIVRKDLAATTQEDWDRTLAINLSSAFHLVRAAVPHLVAGRGGAIVMITSTAAHRGGVGHPAYAASKGGLLAVSRTLAVELAPHRIRVNSVSPGVIGTAINRDAFTDPDLIGRFDSAIPLGRTGTPRDVEDAIAFLVGPGSAYVTGIDLAVDGGLMSRTGLS